VIGRGARWVARRSAAVVVIAQSFVDVHRRWGTADRTTVIPNWAPLGEIVPTNRHNAWAREQGIADVPSLVYSGTLGLKHNPSLLVGVARQVRDAGVPVHLTVVSEGPAVEVLREEAARLDVPITVLPFQPYDRLPEVLGSGDVLVVLLDKSAGAFSVPSMTLSYLCAGRPVLGLMPAENLAATLVTEVDGCVLPPDEAALAEAGRWVADVLRDDVRRERLGHQARALAERQFDLDGCATRFEEILGRVAGVVPAAPALDPDMWDESPLVEIRAG
jgi:putative colanic acid biosynthesis glycosyltransferase WcaI